MQVMYTMYLVRFYMVLGLFVYYVAKLHGLKTRSGLLYC